jgi:hypothetical protein
MASKKQNEKTGRDQGQDLPFKDTPPSDVATGARAHLPLPSSPFRFYHFPVVHSDFESVNGLTHSLGLHPHDPVVSGNALTNTPRGVVYQSPKHLLIQLS